MGSTEERIQSEDRFGRKTNERDKGEDGERAREKERGEVTNSSGCGCIMLR